MKSKKPWIYLVGAALLLLLVKYSEAIFQAGGSLVGILMPMLVGCAMAYVLNILVNWVERLPLFQKEGTSLYQWRRGVSILAALVILVLLVVLLVLIVIPQLVEATGVVLAGIPPMVKQAVDWISQQEMPLPEIETWLDTLDLNWPQLAQKVVASVSAWVTSLFASTLTILTSVGGAVVQVVVAFIFALYLLAGKDTIKRQVGSVASTYLKPETFRRLSYLWETANDTFRRFIVGQVTEAVIIGVLCTLGMLLLGFPYATMIGVLIGATALLPIVGAYLGAGIGAFMIFTVNPIQAGLFLIFTVVLQQLEGNLIYPRVVGSSIGLPGIWVLAAVTVGGGLGGILGMLLAVPMTATAYKLLQRDVARRRGNRQPAP